MQFSYTSNVIAINKSFRIHWRICEPWFSLDYIESLLKLSQYFVTPFQFFIAIRCKCVHVYVYRKEQMFWVYVCVCNLFNTKANSHLIWPLVRSCCIFLLQSPKKRRVCFFPPKPPRILTDWLVEFSSLTIANKKYALIPRWGRSVRISCPGSRPWF